MEEKSCKNCIHGAWAISGYVCTRHFMTEDILKNKVCSYWKLKEEEKNAKLTKFKIKEGILDELRISDIETTTFMEPLITTLAKDVVIDMEDNIIRAVQEVGINVYKERLVKALTDARSFYDEGYAAAEKKYLHIIKEINGEEEE